MKKNFRRLFVILCVAALLFSSVGCDRADGDLSDTDGKSEAQTEDTVIPQDPGTETEKPGEETDPGNTDADTVSFCAYPYIQHSVLSWTYSLDVQIEDVKVYINGILYEQAPSPVPPVVLYPDAILFEAERLDKANEDLKITDTLKKIKESEPFCVLETDQYSKFGETLSVYKFDNVYFFVSFFDNGQVMRIHRAVIEGTAEM